MSKISQKTINRIKDTIPITDVFEWLGARVRRQGNNTMAFCPFCADAQSRSPGCSLNDDLGLFHCFVCGASGDTISAVRQHEECTFVEAIEMLGERFNIPIERIESSDPEAESHRKRLVEVLNAAQNNFIEQRDDPHFEQFLKERNIPLEVADRFGLGISLYTRANELVSHLLEAGFTKEELVEAGLCFIDDETGEAVLRFKNRLMFPIHTIPGTLVGFGGRDLTGRSPAKYKNSPESPLFKKRNIMYGMNVAKKYMSKSDKAIVCEGYMDTIALQSHGFEYAIGAMGTALTEYNLKKLSNFASTIYISLDSDRAGIAAAMRVIENIPSDFTSEVKVLMIPEVICHDEQEVRATSLAKADEYLYENDENGNKTLVHFPISVPMAKDPDEFFNQVGHTPEEFERIMDDSVNIFLFCIMNIMKKSVERFEEETNKEKPDPQSVAQIKTQALAQVDDLMVRIYDKTTIYQREVIADYVNDAIGNKESPEEYEIRWRLRASTNPSARKHAPQQSMHEHLGVFNNEATTEEDILIGTLFFHPECREVIRTNLDSCETVFTSQIRKSIFNKIDEGYGKGLNNKQISNAMDEQEAKELSRIIMVLDNNDIVSDSLSEDNIRDICRNVERHALENELSMVSNTKDPDIMKIIEIKTKLAKFA